MAWESELQFCNSLGGHIWHLQVGTRRGKLGQNHLLLKSWDTEMGSFQPQDPCPELLDKALVWDHLGDHVPHALCPTGEMNKLFTEALCQQNFHQESTLLMWQVQALYQTAWEKPTAETDAKVKDPVDIVDLKMLQIDLQKEEGNDEDGDHVISEGSFLEGSTLAHDCPFTFLDLSPEDSVTDEPLDSLQGDSTWGRESQVKREGIQRKPNKS